MAPSCTASSTPVTVTVWATLQFAVVNVTLAGATVPSAGLLLEIGIVTSAVGWLVSTIVNVAVPPASVVTGPAVGATVVLAVSSTRFVAATSLPATLLYCGSVLAAGPITSV